MNRSSTIKSMGLALLLGAGAVLPLAARADVPRPLQVHGYHHGDYRAHRPLRHHAFRHWRHAPGYDYYGYRYRLTYPWYRRHDYRVYRHHWRRDDDRAHRRHADHRRDRRFERRR